MGKCSECDITANLIKCNEEKCDKIYCNTHVDNYMSLCSGGCSEFFCEADLESHEGDEICSTCKQALDDEEY